MFIGEQTRCVALRGLEKSYRGFRLQPISLDIGTGVTCLVGANGAGKSTLLRLIAGLERPDAGSVDFGAADGGRPQVGYLPQSPRFPKRVRCEDYLWHVGWLMGVPRPVREERVMDALASCDLSEKAGTATSALSGGMLRRLALAAALVAEPQVTLLDEPTAGLDPLQRISMRATIRSSCSRQVTIVSTHHLDDVAELADNLMVLHRGQLRFSGSKLELMATVPPEGPGATLLEKCVTHLMKDTEPSHA